MVAALCALAASLAAQTPPPQSVAPSSTATYVDMSTAAMIGLPAKPAEPGAAAPAQPGSPQPPDRPIRVHVHKEAKDWEPISVRAGGDPRDLTSFSWRVKTIKVKGKKHTVGQRSPVKVAARVYKAGEDKRLVISMFPKALAAKRVHVELRLLIVEGYLEKAEVVAVTAAPGAGPADDAAALQAKGIVFQEESPASADVRLTAVDAKPGKETFNAGSVKKAEFVEHMPDGMPGLGRVDFEWALFGLKKS